MGLPYADPTNTGEWADDFLTEIAAPETASNVVYVEAWETDESPSGYGYNPLGTEEKENNSKNANAAGVQAFTSWAEGFQAIADTLVGNAGNKTLVTDLQSGDASLGELASAQKLGSWSTGAEPEINALGTSTAFTYGGSYGETPKAPGIATSSSGVLGDITNVINPLGSDFLGSTAVPNAIGSGLPSFAGSIFKPLVGWIEEGAADITFIGFGLLLVAIGLAITFKSEGEEAAPAAAAVA